MQTTASVYNATEYAALYDLLLQYRRADTLARQKILYSAIQQLENLNPEVKYDDTLALRQYKTMVYIATLIRYVENIRKLEAHEYIDVLKDFKGMDLTPDANQGIRIDLSEWFEMSLTEPKIKFKQHIRAYSGSAAMVVWQSFEKARARHLALHGRTTFQQIYRPINSFTDNDDGLFPGVFTWMGKYHNEAVDRLVYSNDGTFLNVVSVFEESFLSSGGMRNGDEEILKKAIQESIEEHYCNIALAMVRIDTSGQLLDIHGKKIALKSTLASDPIGAESTRQCEFQDIALYNLIPLAQTHKISLKTWRLNLLLINHAGLSDCFTKLSEKTDGDFLVNLYFLIAKIDELCIQDHATKLDLIALKASFLSELFIHTPLYPLIFEYMQEKIEIIKVPQLLDMRTGSGSQMTSLVLCRSFEEFMALTLSNENEIRCFGDDVSLANRTPITLMMALKTCSKMKFSHLLLMFEAYKYGSKIGDLQPGHIWQSQDFIEVRTEMISQINKYI